MASVAHDAIGSTLGCVIIILQFGTAAGGEQRRSRAREGIPALIRCSPEERASVRVELLLTVFAVGLAFCGGGVGFG